MRLILLLIALTIVGLLVKQQLTSSSSNDKYENVISDENLSTPKVPSSPQDINKFENDMNDFLQDAAKNRAREDENNF